MKNCVPNLYLLTRCDMNCTFCYASKNIPDMCFDNAIKVIDNLSSYGVKRINITGGEVLLYDNVNEVVKYASRKMSVALFTSGALLNKEYIEEIYNYVDWWALSLEGPAHINKKMGRSAKHFSHAINALEILRVKKAKVRLTTVVNKNNIDEIESLAGILIDKEVIPTLWRIKQMVPTRKGKTAYNEVAVGIKKFIKVTSRLKNKYRKLMDIQCISTKDKSGDTLCIHPDGNAKITLGDVKKGMEIIELGNFIDSSEKVKKNWNKLNDNKNSFNYRLMWEALQ